MSFEASTQLRPPAHPMPGWLAVMKIPAPPADSSREAHLVQVGPLILQSMATTPGVIAAVVIEPGEMRSDYEAIAQLVRGTKVFFQDGVGIAIGDYHYIGFQSVIAWEGEDG